MVRGDPAEYTARFTAGEPATGTLIGGNFGTLSSSVGWTLADVVSGWLDRLSVPVLGGLPVGHGRNPATVPLGTRTTIDPAAGRMTVSSGVR